jgi:addiction module RelE/StbE family toxin
MQVRWTGPATQDLEDIARFIQKDRPASARSVGKSLFDAANGLEVFPSKGRTGKIAGTRELIVANLPYIIVYKITDAAIHILRVYHGARDWPKKQ